MEAFYTFFNRCSSRTIYSILSSYFSSIPHKFFIYRCAWCSRCLLVGCPAYSGNNFWNQPSGLNASWSWRGMLWASKSWDRNTFFRSSISPWRIEGRIEGCTERWENRSRIRTFGVQIVRGQTLLLYCDTVPIACYSLETIIQRPRIRTTTVVDEKKIMLATLVIRCVFWRMLGA